MSIEITCSEVHVSKEEWGHLIAWGAEKNPEENYLMLQAADEYSEDDVRLGMNDIYVECCGQGWSWYGHIQSFRLSRHSVDVKLDAAAADHMGNDGRIHVQFSVDDAAYGNLQLVLRHIFNGRACFTEA
ncbi:MAG: Imm10 family immunity protein [Pseudomonadota bacterium]|nr:Imm10 family immunity protein [Pseudomonadota bacterium]